MERIVIDTNVLVNFILKTELTEKAEEIVKLVLTVSSAIILTNILEETTFFLIREELVYRGIEKFHDQKKFIRKNGHGVQFVYNNSLDFERI